MSNLPTFVPTPQVKVDAILASVFSKPNDDTSFLEQTIHYPDHHFRAVFHHSYFTIQPEAKTISKSQWNTLKKKLKRHHPLIFVFKDYGTVEDNNELLYLDFGFLAPRE